MLRVEEPTPVSLHSLLACHLTVAKGLDPDYPRNLSKTLTMD